MRKSPPYSQEAEMCSIGCATATPVHTARGLQLLQAKHFYLPAHKIIWNAITEMSAAGFEADIVSLAEWLKSRDRLNDAGGMEYLANIVEMVPQGLNQETHAKAVFEYWQIREMQSRAQEFLRELSNPVRDLESKIQMASQITSGVLNPDTGASTAETIELSWDTALAMPLGIGEEIDRATGGVVYGQLSVLQAATGAGKSVCLIQAALNCLYRGGKVIFVTLADLNQTQIARRMIRQMCGWDRPPADMFRNAVFEDTVDEWRRFGDRFTVYDAVLASGSTDVESVTSWLDARMFTHPADMVCVDYAQRLTTQRRTIGEAEAQRATAAALGKWAARQQTTATIVGSQENDDGRVAWSKDWEKEAALILRFTRSKETPNIREWTVVKNRHGASGATGSWNFNTDYLCMEDAA